MDIDALLGTVEKKTAERVLKVLAEEAKKKGDSSRRDELNTSEITEKIETAVQPTVEDSLPKIVILTSLYDPECLAVLGAFDCQWGKEGREGVLYRTGILDLQCGKRVQLAVASQSDMGMVPATILATKSIISWRPHLIAMTGICAGMKDKVSLGDLIIAKQVIDYGAGKLKEDGFAPDYCSIGLDTSCASYIQEFSSREGVMHNIRTAWAHRTGRPDTELRAHLGVIASGAAVIAQDQFLEGLLNYQRSILGVEMEAYGIAKAAEDAFPGKVRSLIIKGVQDYAGSSKSDEYREYSAFVSARFLKDFLNAYMVNLL